MVTTKENTNNNSSVESLKKKKKKFRWIFIFSTLLFLIAGYFLMLPEYYQTITLDGETAEAAHKPESSLNIIVVYTSLIASIVSLITRVRL